MQLIAVILLLGVGFSQLFDGYCVSVMKKACGKEATWCRFYSASHCKRFESMRENCKRKCGTCDDEMTCPAPQTFASCASSCPRTCQNPHPVGSCNRACHARCVCPKNMVQPDKDTPKCIEISECPEVCKDTASWCGAWSRVCDKYKEVMSKKCKKTCGLCTIDTRCPKPQVFRSCASNCPRTCQDPQPRSCNRGCYIGCVCPENMVQSDKDTLKCIDISECPNS